MPCSRGKTPDAPRYRHFMALRPDDAQRGIGFCGRRMDVEACHDHARNVRAGRAGWIASTGGRVGLGGRAGFTGTHEKKKLLLAPGSFELRECQSPPLCHSSKPASFLLANGRSRKAALFMRANWLLGERCPPWTAWCHGGPQGIHRHQLGQVGGERTWAKDHCTNTFFACTARIGAWAPRPGIELGGPAQVQQPCWGRCRRDPGGLGPCRPRAWCRCCRGAPSPCQA